MKIRQDVYICDKCGKKEILEINAAIGLRVGYISPIIEWYKVNKHAKGKLHFCSNECLSLWAAHNNLGD